MRGREMARSQPLVVALGCLAALLAGCASGATTTNGPTRTPTTTVTTTGGGTTTASGIDPTKLGSLTNYAYTEATYGGGQQLTITGQVNSDQNYQVDLGVGVITRYINGVTYDQIGATWRIIPNQPSHLDRIGLRGFATQAAGIVTDPAYTIMASGDCAAGGAAGINYQITTVANTVVTQRGKLCVARDSGALLELELNAQNTGATTVTLNERFLITQVGTVPPFSVPAGATGG